MSEHNQKHLTLSNRTYIEQELLQKSTFSSIGKVLHKDPSTISKEVKRYSKTVPAKYSYKCNLCKHYKDCDLLSSELHCQSYHNRYCSFYCKRCYRRNPTNVCPYFLPYKCDKINICEPFQTSDRRDSNPRPRPWQGRAPPTEPLAHLLNYIPNYLGDESG